MRRKGLAMLWNSGLRLRLDIFTSLICRSIEGIESGLWVDVNWAALISQRTQLVWQSYHPAAGK